MLELRTVILALVLAALVSVGQTKKHNRSPTPPDDQEGDDTQSTTTTTTEPSPLARAYWCRARNGTYVPLGYTYMQSTCTMCQCTPSHAIRCSMLQCLPTHCIDGSAPVRRPGQCCTQCAYDEVLGNTSSCVYNGVTFPHGTVMKTVENQMMCWCQLGHVECRNSIASLYQSMSVFSDRTTIYVVVVIILIVVIVGVILCCGCTLFYYYYYQRYQQTVQQQYEEYVNSAGWQPMGEEDQNPADITAEEKRLEAEKYQSYNGVSEGVPPPYGAHSNPFDSGVDNKKI